jgi:PKD repeat protein
MPYKVFVKSFYTTLKKIYHILIFFSFFLLISPLTSFADLNKTINIKWQYFVSFPDLAGYHIYQNNELIHEIYNPLTLNLDMEVLLETGENLFTITAFDIAGNESAKSRPYTIELPEENPSGNLLPLPKISASTLSGIAPLSVDFDGSESIDYDGNIINYSWDFENGQIQGESFNHIFQNPGIYNISLTVTDNENITNTRTCQITVLDEETFSNQAPAAIMETDISEGYAPLPVNFDAGFSSDPDGEIVEYFWNFGDGQTGNQETEFHIFAEPGTYTITLLVTDNEGGIDQAQAIITVNEELPGSDPEEPFLDNHLLFWDSMDSLLSPHQPEKGASSVFLSGPGEVPAIVNDEESTGFATSFSSQDSKGFMFQTSGNAQKDAANIIFDYKPDFSDAPEATAYLFRGGNDKYRLIIYPSGYIIFEWNDSIAMSAFSFNQDQWYQIRCIGKIINIGDGKFTTQSQLWINQTLIASAEVTNSKNYPFGADWFIGQKQSNQSYSANGIIDEFKIYATPISALADTVIIEEGSSITIDVLANDFDIDDDTLTLTQLSSPQNGSASIIGNTIVYQPEPDFSGNDFFTYQISDGQGSTGVGEVFVSVLAKEPEEFQIFWDKMDSIDYSHTPKIGEQTVFLKGCGNSPTLVEGLDGGKAVSFNNDSDKGFIIPITEIGQENAATIIFSYKPVFADAPQKTAYLFRAGNDKYRLSIFSSGYISFEWNDLAAMSKFSFNKDQWYNIRCLGRVLGNAEEGYTTEIQLWIDNTLVKSISLAGSDKYAINNSWMVGQKQENQSYGAMGVIDEFKIYNEFIE